MIYIIRVINYYYLMYLRDFKRGFFSAIISVASNPKTYIFKTYLKLIFKNNI